MGKFFSYICSSFYLKTFKMKNLKFDKFMKKAVVKPKKLTGIKASDNNNSEQRQTTGVSVTDLFKQIESKRKFAL